MKTVCVSISFCLIRYSPTSSLSPTVSHHFHSHTHTGDGAIQTYNHIHTHHTQDPPLHFASFGSEGVLATASVEGHVVKVWPPMTPQAGIPVQPQARLEVGVSRETPEPGIIHRSAAPLEHHCVCVFKCFAMRACSASDSSYM